MLTSTRSRCLGALASTLLLGLGVLTAPPASAVTTTVDCSSGPVVLDVVGGDYLLTGACSRVVVTGVYADVRLTTADEVVFDAPGGSVTATGTIRSLKLTRLGSGIAVTGPEIRRIRSNGATTKLVVGRVGTIRSTKPYVDVRIGSARRAIIGSDVSKFRFGRLGRLDIDASTTSVRVSEGSTRVHDTGFRTAIRVHRRR